MTYIIKQYTKDRAKELGVIIIPSLSKNKTIYVYKDNKKIATIGDIRYKDYPTYLEEDKALAISRQRLYKIRHAKDINIKNSNGYYANKLLW